MILVKLWDKIIYMSFQTLLSLLISILTAATAQIILKKGALEFPDLKLSFSSFFDLIIGFFQNKWLLAGMILFVISFCFYIFVLSKIQLNFAYPVMVRVGMIFVTIGSWIFFGEKLSLPNIIGIALIILGIFLLVPKG